MELEPSGSVTLPGASGPATRALCGCCARGKPRTALRASRARSNAPATRCRALERPMMAARVARATVASCGGGKVFVSRHAMREKNLVEANTRHFSFLAAVPHYLLPPASTCGCVCVQPLAAAARACCGAISSSPGSASKTRRESERAREFKSLAPSLSSQRPSRRVPAAHVVRQAGAGSPPPAGADGLAGGGRRGRWIVQGRVGFRRRGQLVVGCGGRRRRARGRGPRRRLRHLDRGRLHRELHHGMRLPLHPQRLRRVGALDVWSTRSTSPALSPHPHPLPLLRRASSWGRSSFSSSASS
jgi:hypothetical protein